jgi:hypothetical protein
MRQTPHIERHFIASESVRDVVISMSDGVTVPFTLAAGLSGAVASSGIVITAGLAEIALRGKKHAKGSTSAASNDDWAFHTHARGIHRPASGTRCDSRR